MPRYIFSGGKVTVEEGVYTPFKTTDKQSVRGVLILARDLLETSGQPESIDKEHHNVKQQQ